MILQVNKTHYKDRLAKDLPVKIYEDFVDGITSIIQNNNGFKINGKTPLSFTIYDNLEPKDIVETTTNHFDSDFHIISVYLLNDSGKTLKKLY